MRSNELTQAKLSGNLACGVAMWTCRRRATLTPKASDLNLRVLVLLIPSSTTMVVPGKE